MPRANTLFIGRLPPGPAWRGGSKPRPTTKRKRRRRSETGCSQGFGRKEWSREGRTPRMRLQPSRRRKLQHRRSSIGTGPIRCWRMSSWATWTSRTAGAATAAGRDGADRSTAGPIAAIAPREAYQDAVLGFEIVGQDADGSRTVNTNWPRRLSFPTFCLNVLEYLAGGSRGLAARLDAAGPACRTAPRRQRPS